jgi:hypothetical protein
LRLAARRAWGALRGIGRSAVLGRAHREETASLLAKHEKALFWENVPSTVFYFSASAYVLAYIFYGQQIAPNTIDFLSVWAVLFFVGATIDLRYCIYRSKVDTLKELRRVQLQILELQASLQKRNCE